MCVSAVWLCSTAIAGSVKEASFLFTLQTACAFGFALASGAFLASDCISEEKRDGGMWPQYGAGSPFQAL